MSLASASSLEDEYVHRVYSRLATYAQKERKHTSPRVWPNVTAFVKDLPPGSVVVDVGCGEAKYQCRSGFVIGCDTCPDVLAAVKTRCDVDLLIGDALKLPVRSNSADAVLLISVLHHLSTPSRRKAVLEESVRCVRMGGRMLVCVWAHEQPRASFPSQDILVPWHMNETALNGRLPSIRFHKDSTKEQRVIQASIAIPPPIDENACPTDWLGRVVRKIRTFTGILPGGSPLAPPSLATPPPATPRFHPQTQGTILSGIKRWSPMLGRRIASLLVSVEEQLAEEMAETIMSEAVTETMAAIGKQVTFYRFYHVFRKDELLSLLSSIPSLRVVSCQLEHANWCVLVEKIDENAFRV